MWGGSPAAHPPAAAVTQVQRQATILFFTGSGFESPWASSSNHNIVAGNGPRTPSSPKGGAQSLRMLECENGGRWKASAMWNPTGRARPGRGAGDRPDSPGASASYARTRAGPGGRQGSVQIKSYLLGVSAVLVVLFPSARLIIAPRPLPETKNEGPFATGRMLGSCGYSLVQAGRCGRRSGHAIPRSVSFFRLCPFNSK